MREETVKSLDDYISKIIQFVKTGGTHEHLRWWFRGVPDVSDKLIPGIYRSKAPHGSSRADAERHAFRDFELGSAGLIPSSTSRVDLYFQQQHHGLPTRLLDWTTNALIAIYFAVEKNKPPTDAAVYAMDAYGLGDHKYKCFDGNERTAKGFAVVNDDPNSLLAVALADVVQWRTGFEPPNFIFPVRPAFTDLRMQIQRGCFTCHPPKLQELTERENASLCRINIPAKDVKDAIKEQLLHLGIDHFSVFGDIDSLAKTITDNYRLYYEK
jgi:hypothetical protein